MKPTLAQRFFASRWLVPLWFSSWSLLTIILCLRVAEFDLQLLSDWKMAGWYLLLAVVTGALGVCFAVFPGVFIIGPLLHCRSLMNGAPFTEGDKVQVIGGRYAGRQSEVYSRWQGDAVRVRIGGGAAKKYEDVFGANQLLKLTKTEQNSAPDHSHGCTF